MVPRDLYTMDDAGESGAKRPDSNAAGSPFGGPGTGSGKPKTDLEIEKNFLQLTRVDTEQFRFFYEKYHDVIFDYIYWKTGDYELTGDLTGDVFLEALNKLDRFTWQGYSFGAWLFHIGRRTVSKHYRRDPNPAERAFESERVANNQLPTPHLEAMRKQDMQLIRECMLQLSSDKHDALVLHYWLDMTVRQMALAMKTSESNVKKHLVRGRRQMLSWLRDNGLNIGLSEVGMKMIREADACESGWHLVDDLNEKQ
jgi:RNA polymerase sigma factor (sigma-70 family)